MKYDFKNKQLREYLRLLLIKINLHIKYIKLMNYTYRYDCNMIFFNYIENTEAFINQHDDYNETTVRNFLNVEWKNLNDDEKFCYDEIFGIDNYPPIHFDTSMERLDFTEIISKRMPILWDLK